MRDLTRMKRMLLKSPEFQAEFQMSNADLKIMKVLIDARCEKNMTQKQLAQLAGVTPACISTLERGASNTRISTLEKIAHGLGKELHVEFK